MAARKSNTAAILVVVAIAAGAWFFLSRRKKPAAGGAGTYGGGTGLPNLGGGRVGGGPSGGGGGGAQIPFPNFSGPTLAQRIARLLGFVKQGNQQGLLLQSSNQYLPGLGTADDLSIPLQPMQLFDVGQLAQPIPLFDTSSVSPTDASLSDQSIPFQSIDTGGVDPNSFLQTQDINYGPDTSAPADIQVTPTDYLDAADFSSYLNASNTPTLSVGDIYSGQGAQDLNPADYSFA